MAVPAGVLTEADADAWLRDALARALEANERGERRDQDRAGDGKSGRPRGPGARSGRRDYSHLPRVEVIWDFPGGGYCCPQCGEPFTRLGDHVIEQLDWQVVVRVAAHCRRRYRRACGCRVPATVMAPGPPKAIGKGLATNGFIVRPLTERYVAGQLAGDGPRRLVISSDFYAVYTSAGKKADGLVNLFCWAHVRRYFVRAGDANPVQLRYWTAAWLERIKNLYAAHEELMSAWAAAAAPAPREAADAAARLEEARAAWDAVIAAIDAERGKQMAAPGLQEPAKKALATLDREWDGLIAHREFPMVSLDNNAAERALRRPVVTRKNAYGSRNEDAARLAARAWTVTATAEMAGLNVLTYLTAYLDACGRNGGKPLTGPDLERFLPWTASPADLHSWAHPPPAG